MGVPGKGNVTWKLLVCDAFQIESLSERGIGANGAGRLLSIATSDFGEELQNDIVVKFD